MHNPHLACSILPHALCCPLACFQLTLTLYTFCSFFITVRFSLTSASAAHSASAQSGARGDGGSAALAFPTWPPPLSLTLPLCPLLRRPIWVLHTSLAHWLTLFSCRVSRSRDAYLTALCTSCLPEHYSISTEVPPRGWEISSKHLQCVHILLNSALCLGSYMDTGWNLIISTCQQVRHKRRS